MSAPYEFVLALAVVLPALWLRPWRMLAPSGLQTPLFATLALLPLLWALPHWHAMPLQLPWSGACLVLLCLGWPLAVPVLTLVAGITWALTTITGAQALSLLLWQGLAPATLALGLGALLRRTLPPHPFIYILGRGFLGTALCVFAARLLAQAAGHTLPHIGGELSWVALWLMAWADAVVTGLLTAIFVAYRPQWLATWSDTLYLPKS
ncbi:hypothetical protein DW355_13180 [Hylemonella gracilis]|jgi:uncharacterized membrane protein|uniref:Energy-coupling factor ABC transporter permease n=1 Tax=Hylemonella gracilis TaxID=80880 RepID=A0A4P6UPH7_9BURK|nr:hypothetical protein [Hylemonella gracilis]QBK05561.1 hypothetical protein DW355_13180 [Hylemonella gracilis]